MWSCPEKEIPEEQIRDECLKVLYEVVRDSLEFDVRTNDVYEALEYLESSSIRSWGFTLFKEGLENNSPFQLGEGYKYILKHLGQ